MPNEGATRTAAVVGDLQSRGIPVYLGESILKLRRKRKSPEVKLPPAPPPLAQQQNTALEQTQLALLRFLAKPKDSVRIDGARMRVRAKDKGGGSRGSASADSESVATIACRVEDAAAATATNSEGANVSPKRKKTGLRRSSGSAPSSGLEELRAAVQRRARVLFS
eukprot:INCI17235.2.p1 GENE.INCI17235.2~~INCI17235.2.p1  ORF type:complete len:166 (+),score=36.33 INCI17235.2:339-836(+)